MRTLDCVSVAARARERPGLLSARPGPLAWEPEPATPASGREEGADLSRVLGVGPGPAPPPLVFPEAGDVPACG